MSRNKILLNAYFEALYNILLEHKAIVNSQIEQLLVQEIEKLEAVSPEKIDAYRDACLAFVDERLEMYNPIGLQYTFDTNARLFAKELELQLNWFDSTDEFNELLEAITEIEKGGFDEGQLEQLAKQLIEEFGAFPDKSIIESYLRQPSLQKMPDYLVARAIERIIKEIMTL